MGKKKEAKCPKCKKRGGVRARYDAFEDYKLIINSKEKPFKYELEGSVSFDQVIYECFECNQNLDLEEIKKENL